MEAEDKVRIDKWLWAVRIFKSRTLSNNAVKSGKVKVGEKSVKPSFMLTVDQTLYVRKNGFDLTFLVKDIIKKRVSATLAAPCYEDLTPDSEKNKYKDWYIGKASAEMRGKGEGRPTKRERREIDDYKDENYFEFDFDEDEL
ncbi:MAG TPA: RNA-binding protein [Saprospirales bacterium]|jgi:ribosome-associated heat shock protein Hsp15|nr:RNA-binding S4 domain-containing protein [Saprospiraceae bacterium]HAW05720.1 RNA-binding protein [Saprospirales bacterium]